jgi:hypothetical protein
MKEDRIAEHLRSGHGGLVDGWMGGLTVVKGTRYGGEYKYTETARVTQIQFEIRMFYYGNHIVSSHVCGQYSTPCSLADNKI